MAAPAPEHRRRESAIPTSIVSTQRALLSRLLPDDEPAELVVRQGQFHVVVIGSDRVVCLPRTKAAADRLPKRAATLRALAGLRLGLHAPEPLLHGGTDGTPFLVLSRIHGEPLEPDALDDVRVLDAVATQYATLLSTLARASSEETARTALPHSSGDRWPRFAEDVRAKLFQVMSDGGRLKAERELAAVEGLTHVTTAVVHGDLGAENVLWEWGLGLPHLSGVLDWDDVAIGDPAEDLAAIGASYRSELLERVLALGGWSTPGLGDRMTAIRGTFALQQALQAVRDGDEEELADGLANYR